MGRPEGSRIQEHLRCTKHDCESKRINSARHHVAESTTSSWRQVTYEFWTIVSQKSRLCPRLVRQVMELFYAWCLKGKVAGGVKPLPSLGGKKRCTRYYCLLFPYPYSNQHASKQGLLDQTIACTTLYRQSCASVNCWLSDITWDSDGSVDQMRRFILRGFSFSFSHPPSLVILNFMFCIGFASMGLVLICFWSNGWKFTSKLVRALSSGRELFVIPHRCFKAIENLAICSPCVPLLVLAIQPPHNPARLWVGALGKTVPTAVLTRFASSSNQGRFE